MNADDAGEIYSLLWELSTSLRQAQHIVDQAAHASEIAARRSPRQRAAPIGDLIDETVFCVRWKGRECNLGYTIPFQLIRRLARRPNQYFSHEQLLEDVWGGPRTRSAVRSAVSELRMKLIAAGMSEVAGAVDGGNRGHYSLRLDWIGVR